MIDTGDTVLCDGQRYVVACVHDDLIFTAGNPSRTLSVEQCKLETKASYTERMESLRAMAAVQSRQHRPECARARLASMAEC